MKRTELKRKSWIKRGTKPLRKANSARQERRRKSYRAKLAAYRKSLTFKAVEVRSGGRCEAEIVQWPFHIELDVQQGGAGESLYRCARRATHHHHLNYKNLGGGETSAQMVHLCAPCHQAVEAIQHPTRQRNYRRSA